MLIKAILEATLVYWMTLAWIPRGILARLQNICSRFLWKGIKQGNLFAWVKWDIIARPKRWGGWGLKRLDIFAKALAAKLGWQLITTQSLWTKVAYAKYISPSNTMDWIWRDHRNSSNLSIIWKAVLNSLPLICEGLTWRIHEGNAVCIGVDPWIGCGNVHRLPAEVTSLLA